MRSLSVKSDRNYQVIVGVNGLESIKELCKDHSKVLLIAPSSLIKLFKLKDGKNLTIFPTPDGENQKTVATLDRIWTKCSAIGLGRQDAIIGFGGGATTDLAGFASATWLRGITWYAIPTSLAGMVDASVGGKTGVNSSAGKNLIGSFYSPAKVLIDPTFLEKLSKRDLSAGMAEVIKCGFIADYKILNLVQEDDLDYSQLIYRATKVKSRVVSKDFKESKLREILNYGHTLGHAIEKDSKYKLRHGEAVSIGMVFAAELSNVAGGLNSTAVQLHRDLLRKFELPTTYRPEALPKLLELMAGDKKSRGTALRFIGLEDIGKPIWLEAVTSDQITEAYGRISS